MAFVRMNFLDLDWAEYNDKQGFVGPNKGFIAVLKYAQTRIGPDDGNGFAAMADWLREQNFPGVQITYQTDDLPDDDEEIKLPTIIY